MEPTVFSCMRSEYCAGVKKRLDAHIKQTMIFMLRQYVCLGEIEHKYAVR